MAGNAQKKNQLKESGRPRPLEWHDVGGTPTLLELRNEEFDQGGGGRHLADPEEEHPLDDLRF